MQHGARAKCSMGREFQPILIEENWRSVMAVRNMDVRDMDMMAVRDVDGSVWHHHRHLSISKLCLNA